jgi:hypothetical protein
MSVTVGKSIALVVGGMLIGGGTATLILKARYQRMLEEEIASVKAAYKVERETLKKQNIELLDELTVPVKEVKVKPEDKPLTEEDIQMIKVSELISDHGYGGGVIEEEVPRFKMYDRTTPNFNPADEERSEDTPYVISVSEFQTDEEDFDKVTVRYYEEDDTVVSELGSDPLPMESIGKNNMLRFGVGSDDEEIVYVRNETLKIDFEVIRDEGSYTEQVLGLPEWNDRDVKEKPRIKKMRDYRD